MPTNVDDAEQCAPCGTGLARIDPAKAGELLASVPGWQLRGDRLHRELQFADFATLMRFVNLMADLAEAEGHHPDFTVHDWNRLDVSTSTHSAGGLTRNDFLLARKIGELPR